MATAFTRVGAPQAILCMAIEASGYHLCKRDNAARAAGTAVVGLAARTTEGRIMSLALRVGDCAEEIAMEETTFTTENAIEKIASIYKISWDLEKLFNDINDQTNAALAVFNLLSSHESQACLMKLDEARVATQILVRRIQRVMSAKESRGIRYFWRHFLKKKVARRLQHIWGLLDDAGAQPKTIMKTVDMRWDDYCRYLAHC